MYLPRISLLPTMLREIFSSSSLPRVPEPDLVMEDMEQVAAFTETGLNDSALAASYLFHTARISQVIQGCKTVLDLGCGPATQLAQVAEMNPDIQFIGVDLSDSMLEMAQQHVNKLGLNNVSFMAGDITNLKDIENQSVDGVISTVSLHHLPTFEHLKLCYDEIKRVLLPGGAIYLADFGRLKSLKSIIFFAYMNEDSDPYQLLLDYERSLRAAFLKKDFQSIMEKLPGDVKLISTFKLPLLLVVKTSDRSLKSELIEQLRAKRELLDPRFRRDLDDIRSFFKLGGLKNDIF